MWTAGPQGGLQCPHCGGTLKIIAAIENPAVILKVLAHLRLFARAPPEHLRRHSPSSARPDRRPIPPPIR
jgi:uncharacterized protein (UPF0212 family)